MKPLRPGSPPGRCTSASPQPRRGLRHSRLRRPAHGLSLVELMVGITIGLFILAAATLVATGQLSDNRRLLLEAQVQQDVRLAVDMIARDVRRAGYWGMAHAAVWPSDIGTAVSNPYRGISPSVSGNADTLRFYRSVDEDNAAVITSENNTIDAADNAGYRLNSSEQTLQVLLGDGTWQTLTDPAVLLVTSFNVRMTLTPVALPCGVECPLTGPGGCTLQQYQRHVVISLSARSATDANVRRSATTSVRLRNDVVGC